MKNIKIKIGQKIKVIKNNYRYLGLQLPQETQVTQIYETGCIGCTVKVNFDGIFRDMELAFDQNEIIKL